MKKRRKKKSAGRSKPDGKSLEFVPVQNAERGAKFEAALKATNKKFQKTLKRLT